MRYATFLLLLLLPHACAARLEGRALVDSLLLKLPTITKNGDRAEALYTISKQYSMIDPNKGIMYGREMLYLAEQAGNKKDIVLACTVTGLNYQFKSDYQNALMFFTKALMACDDHGELQTKAGVQSHIAMIYQEMGSYDKALEHHFKCLELDRQMNGAISVSTAGHLANIGSTYLLKKDFKKALDYCQQSLAIFEERNNKLGIAQNLGNIATIHVECGNYALALEYAMRSLEIFKAQGEVAGEATNLGNIGQMYLAIAQGKEPHSTGQGMHEPHKPLTTESRRIILQKSIHYLEESIRLSSQLEYLENIVEFSKGLSEAYALNGQYEKSLQNYKLHIQYRDSLHSDENRLKLATLETGREQGLKEKQIQINELAKVKKQRERIIFWLALIMLVIIVGVVTGKFIRQKRRNRHLALERRRHLARIEAQKAVMGDIAHAHSHDVSGQVATILGLADVFNTANYSDPDNKVVIDGIASTARNLDAVVKDMIIKENMLNRP